MAEPASEDPLALWFASAIGQTEKVWQLLEDGEDWMTSHAAMPLYCRVTRRYLPCCEVMARLLGADIQSKSTQQRVPEPSPGLTSTGYVPRWPNTSRRGPVLDSLRCR